MYATSLLEQEGAPSSPQTRDSEFRDVLDASLDPALEMCSRMADMRPAEWDRAVFCINCDEAVLAALEGFDFVEQRRRAVQQDEEKYVETVTAAHVRVPLLLRVDLVSYLHLYQLADRNHVLRHSTPICSTRAHSNRLSVPFTAGNQG